MSLERRATNPEASPPGPDQPQPARNKILSFVVRAGLLVALVVVLVIRVDLGAALDRLVNARLGLIGLAIVTSVASIAIRGARWHLVLRYLDIRVPSSVVVRSFALGFAGGAFVGDSVGTVGRALEFRGRGVAPVRLGYALALDYGYEISTLLVLIVPAVFVLPEGVGLGNPIVWLLLVVVLTLLAVVPFTRVGADLIHRVIARVSQGRLQSTEISDLLRTLPPVGHALLFAVSLASRLVQLVYVWLLAEALGISVPFTLLAAAIIVGGIAVLLPISISGLGTREAGMVALFEVIGRDPGEAVALSLGMFVVIMAARLLAGTYWSLTRSAAADLAGSEG